MSKSTTPINGHLETIKKINSNEIFSLNSKLGNPNFLYYLLHMNELALKKCCYEFILL